MAQIEKVTHYSLCRMVDKQILILLLRVQVKTHGVWAVPI